MNAWFTLTPFDIALPRGAFTGGGRNILRHGDKPICAFTRGNLRPCLHPVWTPAGHVVTSEQPADHPHHRGIWIAADHIGLLMQGPDGVERYDYCFYVDQVFQGRQPGKIQQTALILEAQTQGLALIRQDLDWIGPAEWGAEAGRHVLVERRWTAVHVTQAAVIFDITSEVTPGGDTPVALGPTRHAWFNARLAEGIAMAPAAVPVDDQARQGAANIPTRDTAWVDYSGPVGGGAMAGITVMPVVSKGSAWFVADWGVISVGHIRDDARVLQPKETVRFACRVVSHDGGTPDIKAWAEIPFTTPNHMPHSKTGDPE